MGKILAIIIAILVAAGISIFVICKTLYKKQGARFMTPAGIKAAQIKHLLGTCLIAVIALASIGGIAATAATMSTKKAGHGTPLPPVITVEPNLPTPSATPTIAPPMQVADDDSVLEAISLTEEQLELLAAGHSRYLSRNSLPANAPFRTILSGFSNAVSFPLTMAVDSKWFDEMHGISLTDYTLQAKSVTEITKLLPEKTKEWTKVYSKLTKEELNTEYFNRIIEEIFTSIPYGDSWLQLISSEAYFTTNNAELIKKKKDFLDEAYKKPNGISSLCVYEEPWYAEFPGSAAHIMVSKEYRDIASYITAILGKAVVLGVYQDLVPVVRYGLPVDDGINADFTRTVPMVPGNDADATGRSTLLLGYYDKYDGLAVLIGVNMEDMSVELYDIGVLTTPTPTPTPTPTNTPTPTLKPTKAPTPTPTAKPTKAPTKAPTPTPTPTPKPTNTPTPTPVPTEFDVTVYLYDEDLKVFIMSQKIGTFPLGYIIPVESIVPPGDFSPLVDHFGGYEFYLKYEVKNYTVKAGSNDIVVSYTRIPPENNDDNDWSYYPPRVTPTPKPPQTGTTTYQVAFKCIDDVYGVEIHLERLGAYTAGTKLYSSTMTKPEIPGYHYVSGMPSLPYTVKSSEDGNIIVLVYGRDEDGNRNKSASADYENDRVATDKWGTGDNKTSANSLKVSSSTESKNDTNNLVEQGNFDKQEEKEDKAIADQGKGDSSGTGGENHTVIDPTVPLENHQNNPPAEGKVETPKKSETVITEETTSDSSGNTTTVEQSHDANQSTSTNVIAEPD